MPTPFALVSRDGRGAASLLLGAVAGAVLGSTLLAGITAVDRDIRIAYTWAHPSVFTETDRRQMDAVRAAIPSGAPLIVLANDENIWHGVLWQRGLYPRNTATFVVAPYGPAQLRKLAASAGARWVVLIGSPTAAPELQGVRDLGQLYGLPARVSFGELAP